jgi:Tfp pilus assembly protein PilO
MKKLPKEKRNQLLLAVFITVAVLAGLWFTLIRYQQATLARLHGQKTQSETKVAQITDTIKNDAQIEAELLIVSNKLAVREEDMAAGDLYSAMINSISKFKQPYDLNIPQFNSGGPEAPVNLLPKFPYKQVSVSVGGTADYYDLGQFAADFENRFPSSRLVNLELVPASAQAPGEKEKLTFKMDVISLVKPAETRPAATP